MSTTSTSSTERLTTSSVSSVRLARYDASQVLDVTEDLIHLQTAARIPAEPTLDWLAPAMAAGGFRLFTASIRARLVGFVAGSLLVDHVLVSRLVVAAPALSAHPELPGVLLQALIDSSDQPWVDLVVPRDLAGLEVLLQGGWEPVSSQVGRGQLRLTAANDDQR